MAHGLPSETCREKLGLDETVGYLEAIGNSNRPVLVSVTDQRLGSQPVFQSRGILALSGAYSEEDPPGVWFGLAWPLRDTLNGSFFLASRDFKTASLSTSDGDDYVILRVVVGELELLVTDTNTLGWPTPAPKLTLQLRSLAARLVRWFFYTRPAVREERTGSTFARSRRCLERGFSRRAKRRVGARDPNPQRRGAAGGGRESGHSDDGPTGG